MPTASARIPCGSSLRGRVSGFVFGWRCPAAASVPTIRCAIRRCCSAAAVRRSCCPLRSRGAANVSRTGASRSSMAWLSPPSWKVMPGRSSMRRAYPMRGGCPRGRWGSPSTAVSKAIRAAGSWTDSNFWRISASGIRGRSTLRLWPWPIRRLWSGAGF